MGHTNLKHPEAYDCAWTPRTIPNSCIYSIALNLSKDNYLASPNTGIDTPI